MNKFTKRFLQKTLKRQENGEDGQKSENNKKQIKQNRNTEYMAKQIYTGRKKYNGRDGQIKRD